MKKPEFNRLIEHSSDNLGNGTEEALVEKLEKALEIKLPSLYRQFILEIGYAEIFGDEVYSIYAVPDELPCNGLHFMNVQNEELKNGFIEFFSNDIDGVFYIHSTTGKVYLNATDNEIAKSFVEFYNKILND